MKNWQRAKKTVVQDHVSPFLHPSPCLPGASSCSHYELCNELGCLHRHREAGCGIGTTWVIDTHMETHLHNVLFSLEKYVLLKIPVNAEQR